MLELPVIRRFTLARTRHGELPFLPTLARLADGRLLAAYRVARAHTHCVGRIAVVESSDDGTTWSEPRIVVDTLLDDRDPMLVQLTTGDILLSYFRINWHTLPWEVPGVDVIRSTDGGHSWGEPTPIGSTMRRETDQSWRGFRTGHIATHGPILELSGGDLLAPIYGVAPGGTAYVSSVVRSTDSGHTWPESSEVILGAGYVEPVLTLLPNGQVTALLRTDDGSPGLSGPATTDVRARLTRSDDHGHTWSSPEVLRLQASSAATATLADGGVLLAYGDLADSPRRPTRVTVIDDPLASWDGDKGPIVHDAGRSALETYDQANPAVAELPDGTLLVVSYDIHTREVVGAALGRR
ncbi:sialidase family protein [Kribbella deserti]|uniref:Sialidase family protein n=1 Tax=Kribbella deserti TaxID=1926257 RepID=A0ABV6QRJ1_9ACTN